MGHFWTSQLFHFLQGIERLLKPLLRHLSEAASASWRYFKIVSASWRNTIILPFDRAAFKLFFCSITSNHG